MRNDDAEESVAGQSLERLSEQQYPACMAEHGSFMAPFEIVRTIPHPYSETSEKYAHLLPTEFKQPPYSAAAIPFRWMNRQFAQEIAEQHGLDMDPEREPDDETWLENNKWVLDDRNQLAQLQGFFVGIQPGQSLCFFYAKQTPLCDDERRVIVGVGRVLGLGKPNEYDRKDGKGLRSCIFRPHSTTVSGASRPPRPVTSDH